MTTPRRARLTLAKADARRKKQLSRGKEALERGLRRGNVEQVLEALGMLPKEALAPRLAELRSLLVPALRADLRTQNAAAAKHWLAALQRDAELLERLGAADDEQVWSLLWASIKASNYTLAQRLWAPLRERVERQAPEAARSVDAFIESRGRPEPEAIVHLEDPDLERLGFEPTRAAARSRIAPPPEQPEAAEQQLLELSVAQPWASFAASAERWLSSGAPELAARVAVVAAELAVLELLTGKSARASASLEPARLVVAADRRLAELAATSAGALDPAYAARMDAALALTVRVALGALARPGQQHLGGEIAASVIRRALRLPGSTRALAAAVARLAEQSSLTRLGEVLPELNAAVADPKLWVRSVLALDRVEEQRALHGRRPREATWKWIEQSVRAHLSQPRELAQAIAALSEPDRGRFFSTLEEVLPPALQAELVLALWPEAAAQAQGALVALARQALHESTSEFLCGECDLAHPIELTRFADLTPRGQELFARLEPLVLPHDELFLMLALDRAADRRAARATLEAFLPADAPIDNYLIAIRQAKRLGIGAKPFRERLAAQFAGHLPALSRGFDLASAWFGGRSAVGKQMAQLFIEAARATERLGHTDEELLRLARRVTGVDRQRSRKPSQPAQLQLDLGGVT